MRKLEGFSMERILETANLWDLHVHTPQCSKSSDNYDNDSVPVFCKTICEIIQDNKYGLDMISFTDHNSINVECYKEMRKKIEASKLNTIVLPGVEVDIYLSNDSKTYKHLIFYFREDHCIDELGKVLNKYFKSKKNKKIYFDEFLTFLLEHEYQFAISPHSMKQDVRGIVSDWVDEEKNATRIKMFNGLFFIFWEASKSEIVKAKSYIEEFAADEHDTTAIVSFSDSTSYDVFRESIAEPLFFFRALNNFRGLQMVATEPTRFVENKVEPDDDAKQKNIGEVTVQGRVIELSENLNVIIGGRGKGKSILLEAIAKSFEITNAIFDDKQHYTKSRKNFIDSIDVIIKNRNGKELDKNFKLDFINQHFISNLFTDKNEEQLIKYFEEEISEIPLSPSNKRESIVKTELTSFTNNDNKKIFNAGSIHTSLIQLKDENKINFIEKNHPETSVDLRFDYLATRKSLTNIIELLLGDKIEVTQEIKNAINVVETLYIQTYLSKKIINLDDDIINYHTYLAIDKFNKNQSELTRKKSESRLELKSVIEENYLKYIEKIKVINHIYGIETDKTKLLIKSKNFQGHKENRFFFVNTSSLEHPVEYMSRKITESLNGIKVKNKDKLSLADKTRLLVFGCPNNEHDIYNTGYSRDTLSRSIINDYDPIISDKINIFHFIQDKNVLLDLFIESPGTQTNSIMEFIFHKNSNIPLLIDQPEDNVDNSAIYNDLTKWILKSKFQRQIILVSHDANIVINADAENLIEANYNRLKNEFIYSYGALEYKNNLDFAADILDGGVIALKKRSKKYGI